METLLFLRGGGVCFPPFSPCSCLFPMALIVTTLLFLTPSLSSGQKREGGKKTWERVMRDARRISNHGKWLRRGVAGRDAMQSDKCGKGRRGGGKHLSSPPPLSPHICTQHSFSLIFQCLFFSCDIPTINRDLCTRPKMGRHFGTANLHNMTYVCSTQPPLPNCRYLMGHDDAQILSPNLRHATKRNREREGGRENKINMICQIGRFVRQKYVRMLFCAIA